MARHPPSAPVGARYTFDASKPRLRFRSRGLFFYQEYQESDVSSSGIWTIS